MLKRIRSPLRRRNPRRLSASVRFRAQRLPPKAGGGEGWGACGIPTRLGAGPVRTAGAELGRLNLMEGPSGGAARSPRLARSGRWHSPRLSAPPAGRLGSRDPRLRAAGTFPASRVPALCTLRLGCGQTRWHNARSIPSGPPRGFKPPE